MKSLPVFARAEKIQLRAPAEIGGLREGFGASIKPRLVALDRLRAESDNPQAGHACDPLDVFEVCREVVSNRPFRTFRFPTIPIPKSIGSARNERVEIHAYPAAIAPLRREVRHAKRCRVVA